MGNKTNRTAESKLNKAAKKSSRATQKRTLNQLQISFTSDSELKTFKKLFHGGDKKKRKTKRPLIPNTVTHLSLSSKKAVGAMSFFKNRTLINSLLAKFSKKYFVDVKELVNMGNHLHLKVVFKDIKMFQNFLRVFTGALARKITKANRGSVFGKFWNSLAYTRVILTKYEELGLKGYFEGNRIEREFGYMDRKVFLKGWNQFMRGLKIRPPECRT